MGLSNDEKMKYMKRLLLSRMRILVNQGFYGLLLMHMIYTLDEGCETAATDGKRIYFGPEFLDSLSDEELDFVMMHEILHVALRHCLRQRDRDAMLFNIACDIVVNSNILLSENMDLRAITLRKYGESMHTAPDGKEGYEYTAEQVYEMLSQSGIKGSKAGGAGAGGGTRGKGSAGGAGAGTDWDDHTRWGTEEDETLRDVWVKRLKDAAESISIRDASLSRGTIPLCAKRILQELTRPQVDWRRILNEFVQEEIVDYSFSPPDRRQDDSPFYLPDFNEMDDRVEDILFVIDTSGSMSDEMVTAAYSEVKGAIDQYDGRLKGWLGFFDAKVVEPVPFENEEEFRLIRPVGGGGTDFGVVFKYVRKHMQEKLPASIIILTDGYAPFPKEEHTMGIPVLWLLNNEVVTPPWGKIARITIG